MNNEVKANIAAAANSYIQVKNLNSAKFATDCEVNKSYMSNILNGIFTYTSGADTPAEIPDKYFIQIADVVGYAIAKSYWPENVETREYIEMESYLRDAKNEHLMKMLFVGTGAGKTHTVKQFKKSYPLHTYVVVMHSELTVYDMFNELIRQLDIPNKGTKGYKRAQVIIKLRDIRKNGGDPAVLVDEGENMSPRMRATVKGFYDGIYGYASIAVLGTHDLKDIMENAKETGKWAGPQTYRRFKAGMHTIKPLQDKKKRYMPFFEALDNMGFPIERGLQQLLCEVCDNYGELHDFLEPALRKADMKGTVCTEHFFRLMYNLPKAA